MHFIDQQWPVFEQLVAQVLEPAIPQTRLEGLDQSGPDELTRTICAVLRPPPEQERLAGTARPVEEEESRRQLFAVHERLQHQESSAVARVHDRLRRADLDLVRHQRVGGGHEIDRNARADLGRQMLLDDRLEQALDPFAHDAVLAFEVAHTALEREGAKLTQPRVERGLADTRPEVVAHTCPNVAKQLEHGGAEQQ